VKDEAAGRLEFQQRVDQEAYGYRYRYALEWTGHKFSEILDLHYRTYDETAEAMVETTTYPTTGQRSEAPAA